MVVRFEPDERPERCEQQRQRHRDRDDERRHTQLNDHHTVQRAVQQHDRHGDRHLKQRQPEQTAKRQLFGCCVRERQEAGANISPRFHQFVADGVHTFTISIAEET